MGQATQRPIGIAALEDKIIQQAVVTMAGARAKPFTPPAPSST
jgi:hypothetical protein